jgi:hypothetical protein
MDWITINNTGHFLEKNNLPHGYGMKKAATFLRKSTKGFALNCSKFYDAVKDIPFTYRERQIHSMLLPAIAKISQAAFVEQPINRKINGNSQYGWIDYWVYYEPFVFLIELKHGWHSLKSQKIRQSTLQSWRKAIEQTEAITRSEAKSISVDPNRILKISLMIVTYYQGSHTLEKLTPLNKNDVIAAHEFLINNLNPSPNWNCLWALNKKFQNASTFKDKRNEFYPSVGIIAKVAPI